MRNNKLVVGVILPYIIIGKRIQLLLWKIIAIIDV